MRTWFRPSLIRRIQIRLAVPSYPLSLGTVHHTAIRAHSQLFTALTRLGLRPLRHLRIQRVIIVRIFVIVEHQGCALFIGGQALGVSREDIAIELLCEVSAELGCGSCAGLLEVGRDGVGVFEDVAY